MSTLFGNNISQTYQGLIKLADSTTGVTATTQSLQDGLGNNIPIQVSNTTVNISGSFLVNGQPVSIETGSFATTGSNTFIGNQTITGSVNVTGQYLVNGVPVSGDRNGLITTGSITDTQQITGSLILGNTVISGSLIGNTVNGGLIKIQTEANRSGSVQFNITGSNQISQSNFVFGIAGPASVTQTGSIILSGSNNIILNGFRPNTLPSGSAGIVQSGTFGYINGNNNFVSNIPIIATGSLGAVISNNQLNGLVIIDNPATSSFGTGSTVVSSLNGNLILLQGTTLFRHKSGSFSHNSNITLGAFNSYATSSWFSDSISTISNIGNILQGANTNVLNVSSSVNLNRNLINSNNTTINNQFTNPNNYTGSGSGSVSLSNNIFGGINHTILSSGSNTANRNITNNLVVGSGILLNQISSGSFNTIISNTSVLGTSLIISGSNSSTNGGGSVIVGRYNATGSNQETTNEAVFVVGTGTSDSNRRNAIHIDNSNNTRITGSVSISGSLSVNGSSVVTGSVETNRNGLITTGSATTYPTQTINGSLQISSGSIFARGRNTSANNLAYGELALENITSANSNTGLGNNALRSATSGGGNLAVGGSALSNMTTGINNVGIGNQALLNNISGSNNTAIGANTLQNNVAGFNLAIGTDALKFNTTGQYNNAIGDASLYNNTTGDSNLAIGKNTLFFNTTGGSNVGIGGGALATNVSGSNNVAVGGSALGNSVSSFNLAVGASALGANTTGENNIAIGQSAFQANTTGGKNTAIGWNSGVNNLAGNTNTIIGAQALQENINGSGNVAIGNNAGYYSTGSNGFYVGNDNYGSLSNEQNKSLMYGEFNNTTTNQTLQINATTTIKSGNLIAANNLVVTGSVDIVGNFPGDPGKTFVIRSGSMKMGDFNNSVRIADLNNQPQLFFNGTRKVGFFLGQSNMDQVDTQFGIVSGSENIYTMGGNFNNFRSGSNNLMLGVQNISIKSGSNNIILAKQTSYTTGSNNLILGSLQGVDEAQDYFNLQLPNSNDPIMFKSGSAPLTISGSLKVTNGANITGSLIVSGSNLLVNDISVGRGGGTSNTNTAIGFTALGNNTTGIYNTAVGNSSLGAVTTQTQNTAVGYGALQSNIANSNTAVGAFSMNANTTGRYNVGLGQSALDSNTTGEGNTAIGFLSLEGNVSGNYNVAIGHYAGNFETGNNTFYVDNTNRGSQNASRSGSLIYGTFNSTVANQTLQINAATDIRNNLVVSGSLRVSGDVMFASGSNKTIGTVVLDGGNPGVATVSNSLVTANSLIFLTKQTNTHSGNGTVSVTSKGSGTFSITSNHNGDTDVVAYQIINPA